ncbi:MAG: hypothetical protein ACKOH8_10935, partial [Gemmatimonadota bacterium]
SIRVTSIAPPRTSPVAASAVPAPARCCAGGRWSAIATVATALAAIGLVRGGAMLVARIDPALADGYARWYLSLAGRPVPSTGALEALAAAFPMPEEMLASLRRQIDLAFTGI